MTRLALRGLAARKLRTSLTIIAVLLGVTMIAGTFVLTDTIQKAFDEIFALGDQGRRRRRLRPRAGRDGVHDAAAARRAGARRDQAACPRSSQVAGQINDVAAVVGKDGKVVSTGGAPTIAATYMPQPFAPIGFTEGPSRRRARTRSRWTPRPPTRRASSSATRSRSPPAAPKRAVQARRPRHHRPVDRARRRDLRRLRPRRPRRRCSTSAARSTSRSSPARPASPTAELQRSVASILPPTAQVRTAAQEADEAGDDIREGLSFLTTGLLAFAFIAVLVGAFLIFNTFSITVAQRVARAGAAAHARRDAPPGAQLGAARGADHRRASARSSASSPGSASRKAINELFKALGIDLPTTSLVLESRTIIVCLLVGTIVTLAGALAPALRATRVAPGRGAARGDARRRAGGCARLTPMLAGAARPRRRRPRRRGPAGRGRRHLDQAARRGRRRGDPDPRHRADLAALRRAGGARRRLRRSSARPSSSGGSRARTPRAIPAAPRSPRPR